MLKNKMHKPKKMAILLTISLIFSLFATPVFAGGGEAVRDKNNNTAFITEKSAQWVDYENYLAELTLAVNGTQVREPLDVVIVLDRSGSMDMDYIQTGNKDGHKSGNHDASCPCLNPEHFNLKPAEGKTANVTPGTDENTILYENDGAGTVTVYNAEKGEWVVLDATEKVHLYYQYAKGTLELGAYHFKGELDGGLTRISKWDTTDIRKLDNAGLWDHADAAEGCYDRWSEAKIAIAEFTEALLAANPNNRVSLVPFSIHDDEVVKFLNSSDSGYTGYTRQNERQWLIDRGYFDSGAYGVTTDGTTLSGTYASKVSWTSDAEDITNVLPDLFTTANTDYVYALSEAYEMLATRGATDNKAAVVFLSDGVPYPTSSANISFANRPTFITPLVEAITSTEKDLTYTTEFNEAFWSRGKGYGNGAARHSVDSQYVNNNAGTYSVDGQGAQMVTLSYMIDKGSTGDTLETMASNPESYIEIPADAPSSSEGHLSKKLLNSAIFPGGRDSVLRDEVSKYFYVNPAQTLPAGVTVEKDPVSGNDVIVWDLGEIYAYISDDEPTITIELILKEEYRADMISKKTYYPTNTDATDKGKDIYDPENGPDDPDTGAKLHYTDPDDNPRYDTIGTPKLPVIPTTPSDPAPVTVPMPTVRKAITGGIPSYNSAFTFTMTGATASTPMPVNSTNGVKTVSISGSGTVSLGSIVYTTAGTYVYTIKEVNTNFTGYTYDTASYKLTVTVKAVDNKLTATKTLTKSNAAGNFDQAVFTNNYTETTGDLTLLLSKRLTDGDGNLTGTGKPFGVHVYDENRNLISSVVLTANSGQEVAIRGLQSGKTYYLIEEDWEYYTIEGYTFFESQLLGQKAIGFRASQLLAGDSGAIRIQVNNSTLNELLIPDELVPLAPGVPDNIETIEIAPEVIPATGDDVNPALCLLLVILSGSAIITTRVVYRRKR